MKFLLSPVNPYMLQKRGRQSGSTFPYGSNKNFKDLKSETLKITKKGWEKGSEERKYQCPLHDFNDLEKRIVLSYYTCFIEEKFLS